MFYGSDNFSVGVGLSIATPHYSSRYMAGDQTFHTPNFGDEEFDIPPIALPPSHDPNIHHMSYSMHGVNQGQHQQHAQQQQQHYSTMYLPEHMATPMTMNSPVTYGGSPPTYTNLSSPHPPPQSQMGNPQHMMHHPQQQQQGARPHPTQPQVMGTNVPLRRSPSNNSASPANPESHSEDSDDSVPQSIGGVPIPIIKRPSPEPDRTLASPAVVAKKPKPPKKKKKKDPHEPNKPVSAYALFFRDTQAAIKGQNTNASFGEVSKIVASMWDALDADHKNVYKKKTEAAKKEYLKALAAYRASLVSKGAPTDSPDGSGMYPPPNFNPNMPAQQHYQQQQPPQTYYGNQAQQHQKKAATSPQSTMSPQHQAPHMGPNQQQPGHNHPMMQQMGGSHHMDHQQQQQQQQYSHGGMGQHNPAYMNTMGDGHGMHSGQGGGHNQMSSGHMVSEGQNHSQRQMCVRNGCANVASNPAEADMQGYDEGYCSSQCVVTHCRDVFSNWVSNNQSGNPNYGGGMKYTAPAASTVVGPDGHSYVT